MFTNNHHEDFRHGKRREFIKNGVLLGTLTGIAGMNLLSGCSREGEEGISPAEDLMREHGVLRRITLIYDHCHVSLANGSSFPPDVLNNAALIIRNFVEDYHEKLEEDFLFPRFEKANHLPDLVRVLREQHSAGRTITGSIIDAAGKAEWTDDDKQKLSRLFEEFNRMYRPHAAREDTVLFPEIRNVFSENEYADLGEEFEKKENQLFGEKGFESVVEKVAGLEKQLQLYDLGQFTPAVS
ncbi:MAG: hemerythrin domain-containing protein [Bacteroidota bacterium]|nr:hemerythrin domain-containing protein [Bacteroidota bacterium]